MRRYTSGIAAVVAFGTLSATAGADPVAQSSSQPAATSPIAATAAAASAASKSSTTATGAATTRRVVCLNVSLHCFAAKAGTAAPAQVKAMDLRAPDIRNLYSEAELRKPVEDPYEELQRLDDQQVKVEGARPDPNLPIGILSLPWAAMHPTQAWRIFFPVPSAK